MAIDSVTVGSRPSGTFATMMPIAKMRPIDSGRPMNLPMMNTAAPMASAKPAITRLSVAISLSSGDGVSTVVCVRWAIFPNAVCIAVANTSAVASPLVTDVPASRTLRLRSTSASVERWCVPRHRPRFTGDRGVAHAQGERLDQPAVGGHVVAGAHEDHVAGHDLLRRDHRGSTVAQDSDLVRKQTLQRRHRFLGAVLLPERKGAVDHNDSDDGDGERRHALTRHLDVGEECEERRDPQQDGEEVRELS